MDRLERLFFYRAGELTVGVDQPLSPAIEPVEEIKMPYGPSYPKKGKSVLSPKGASVPAVKGAPAFGKKAKAKKKPLK